MDSERFDGLVRSFGQTRSRRQTLRGLAGATAVVLGASLGAERTAAKRKGRGRVAAATRKPVPCAHEGEKVRPGKSGKGCCQGLAEDAEGRCQPQLLIECCLTQARGYGNCPSCSVGDAVVTCVPKGTCTGQALVGSTSFPIAGTFGTACDAGMASICVEIERCCVGPDGGLIGCALPSYGDGTCSGNFRVPVGGLTCPPECASA
jgi:hypothetical protein